MHPRLNNMKIDNIKTHLKNHGIKPSLQRIKIYEYLINYKNHPTVDTIYKELITEIPTLSKTTVYNTLELFVNNEIAMMITIEENTVRYDANTSIHGHFKCEKCGKVYDFNVENIQISTNSLKGFKTSEKQVYFKGICKNCINV